MPANMTAPASPEELVAAATDQLARRFRQADRTELRRRVRASYDRLARIARITEHLPVLVEHEVADQLRREAARSAAGGPSGSVTDGRSAGLAL